MNKGLLLVMTEPPPGMEEEFHDWYDTEHIPQRMSLPGFEGTTRWKCIDGSPLWLALYDLSSPAVLASPEYRASSGPNSTPWTKRVAPRVGRERIVAEQVTPGNLLMPASVDNTRLVLARYPRADIIRLADALASQRRDGVLQSRFFRAGEDLWLVELLGAPPSGELLGGYRFGVAGTRPDFCSLYAAYSRPRAHSV